MVSKGDPWERKVNKLVKRTIKEVNTEKKTKMDIVLTWSKYEPDILQNYILL